MRDFEKEAREQPGKKYNYNFDSIVRQYMMRQFEPHFTDGPALELGCYHGDSTMVLSGRFADLTVIEASTEAVNIARKRVSPNVKFVNSLIESFEVANKFSSIFMINTLEHMDDAQAVLTQVGKWLDETGKLYILVPNADAASRQIAVYMGLIDSNNAVTTPEWNHGHRRTYSFDTLERDVTQSGLRVVVRGGLIFKALANFQFDAALEAGIINEQYVEACYKLGGIYPTLCASIFVVAQR